MKSKVIIIRLIGPLLVLLKLPAMKKLNEFHTARSSGIKMLRVLTLLTMTLLTMHTAEAQSYLIPVDAPANRYPITFTDTGQVTLIIEFDRAVISAGTATGWTITVGGTPVLMVGNPVAAGNFLRITLPSGISYANRNSVLVSYSTTGTLSVTGPAEPVFTNVQAVNNYIATTADFNNGLYGENPPVDICAQVVDVEVEYNIGISKRYRNSIHYAAPRVWIRWENPAAAPATQVFFVEQGAAG